MIKLITHFLKPYRRQCIVIFAVILADVAAALFVPTITADMINLAVDGSPIRQIVYRGSLMLAVSVLSGLCVLLGSWLCARLSADIGRDIRCALYDKSLSFSASDFDKFGTASMITRSLNDVNIIQQGLVNFIQMVLPVPVMCILGIVFTFRINRNMGFLILGVTLLVLLLATLIVRRASVIFEKLQHFLDRMNTVLRENVTGVRVIRAFNKEPHETRRMQKTFEKYAESAIRANRLFAGLDSLAMSAINLCIVAILYLGGNSVGAGTMKIGDITAVTEYSIWILFYIVMAQMIIMLVPRAMICLRRLSEVLSQQPEITDKPGAHILQPKDENVIAGFDHVSFRFPNADENALNDITFQCRRGETTAIIGGTGSGKSTVTRLLLRFHDATSGTVYMHSENICDISQHSLREQISYVPQKAWLFSGTIAENLRYGNPDATDAELYRALEIAQADFVQKLPSGLNTQVAQGGTNFSGGQRQRLSIARALVRKAGLYIFDDSFSALDYKTDAALRHALAGNLKDAAILIIAQRINTIVSADQILVLHDGKAAGIGTHSELLDSCSIYRDIARSQMKEDDLNGL